MKENHPEERLIRKEMLNKVNNKRTSHLIQFRDGKSGLAGPPKCHKLPS